MKNHDKNLKARMIIEWLAVLIDSFLSIFEINMIVQSIK